MLDSYTFEKNSNLSVPSEKEENLKTEINLTKENIGLDDLTKEDLLVIKTIAQEYKRQASISSKITNIVGFLTELEIDNINVENTKLYRKQYHNK